MPGGPPLGERILPGDAVPFCTVGHRLRLDVCPKSAEAIWMISVTQDVVRLTSPGAGGLLVGAPWDLRSQVRAALAEDLADIPTSAADLRRSAVQAIRAIPEDLLEAVAREIAEILGDASS